MQDGWTDLSRRIRAKIMDLPREQRTPPNMLAAFEDSDFEKMEEIRARVDAIVSDRETAAKLKAWYRQLCKRPCFHDAYLQAFNTPGTHLVDTDGKGVERITENGVVVAGKEYQLDCIIYASGFEVGTEYKRRAGFDLTGRGGVKLSEHWAAGMRTKHGIHVHGFPNAFFVQPTQGANLISNVPHNLTEAAKTIALMVRHAQANGFKEIEVTKEAEDRWVELLLTGAGRMIGSPDCTPGYYNNEGREPGPAAKLNVGHPAGADGLLQIYRRMAQQRPVRGAAVPLTSFPIFVCAREYTTMSQPATTETPKESPKDASASVIAQHAATLKALPFSDTRDFDDAARGFLGTVENAKITSPQGRVVWSLEPYGFLSAEEAPPTVDPSLWRQSRLNMHHGLFEVVPGVYQVRGLDIANMTLIEGDSGVIVVDTLTSIEGARAAMELYFQHRGKRPVAAVIFTHTHTDHWGGARGVLDDETLAERQGADHRAQSVHGARGLRKHHRGAGDAAPRAISVRAAAGEGRARAGRLRARQDDGGGRGGAAASDRPDHRDRRQAHHRRRGIRIPDGAEQRSAGGDAFLHPALQAFEPRGELHA